MTPRLRPVAAAVLAAALLVGATGCGSDDPPASRSDHDLGRAAKSLDRLNQSLVEEGQGAFGQSISGAQGQVVTAIAGTYSLDDEQVRARLTIPDGLGKGKDAVADVLETDGKAWVRTNQFDRAVAGCYLTTTPPDLFTRFGVDVARGGDAVPAPLKLLGRFRPSSSNGGGVVQGTLPLADAVALLPAALATRLAQSAPRGSVPATVGVSGRQVTISIGGFTMVGALSAALQVPEEQLAQLRGMHFTATLGPLKGTFAAVTAPPAGKQMTPEDLSARKCG